MPIQKAIIATTNVVDGIKFSRESLVDAAVRINGQDAVRINLEHDPHYMPIGKTRAAEVIDLEEDRAALVATKDDSHSVSTAIHEATGKRIVEVTFPNDGRPFSGDPLHRFDAPFSIAVDRVNFDDGKGLQEFLCAADNEVDEEANPSIGRRSLTPDPLIQFLISDPVLAGVLAWLFWRGEKFLRYTIDETARKTGDAISDKLSEKMKKWLRLYDKSRSKDSREVTSQVIINVEPRIHLLTRAQELEQNAEIGIESLCRQLDLHQDLLEDSDSVTFARNSKDEEWKLLYITTKSGKVIASIDCYDATLEKWYALTRTFPLCLCLKHRQTKEERHFETTAVIWPLEEQGRYRIRFNSYPDDLDEYEIFQLSLLTEDQES